MPMPSRFLTRAFPSLISLFYFLFMLYTSLFSPWYLILFILLFEDDRVNKFLPSIIDKKAICKALNFRMRSWDQLLNDENWPVIEVQTPVAEFPIPHEEPQEVDVPMGLPP